MRKKDEKLIGRSDIPLLEQEKIKDFMFDSKRSSRERMRNANRKLFVAFFISVIAVLFVCLCILIVTEIKENDDSDLSAAQPVNKNERHK